MSDFKVSIIKGEIKILCEDEVPETDVIDLLAFDETQLEDLYRNHAAIQSRWEQIAINFKNKQDVFIENFEKKWWAHNKRFAKFVLQGYGEKTPTVGDIKDTVILIYSSDTSDLEREKYGEIAYRAAITKDASYKDSKEAFFKEMYKHVESQIPWTYETLVSTTKNLERDVLTVQNIAKRLDSRSYHMKDLKDLVSAKQFNMGPVSETNKTREQDAVHAISGYAPGGKQR